jgi:hypothetical protein
VSDRRPAQDRWYYRRRHDHPMGWALVDAGTGQEMAWGDKSLIVGLAQMLNGKPTLLIEEFGKQWAREHP